jgi:hypothetical protein
MIISSFSSIPIIGTGSEPVPNSNSDSSAVMGKVEDLEGPDGEISRGLDMDVLDRGDKGMVEDLVYERRRGGSRGPDCADVDIDPWDFRDGNSWNSSSGFSSSIGESVGDGGAGYGKIVFTGAVTGLPEV